MSELEPVLELVRRRERRSKRRFLSFDLVPHSQLPYRVFKRRTGVLLGSFGSQEAVDAFIDCSSLEELSRKPISRKTR